LKIITFSYYFPCDSAYFLVYLNCNLACCRKRIFGFLTYCTLFDHLARHLQLTTDKSFQFPIMFFFVRIEKQYNNLRESIFFNILSNFIFPTLNIEVNCYKAWLFVLKSIGSSCLSKQIKQIVSIFIVAISIFPSRINNYPIIELNCLKQFILEVEIAVFASKLLGVQSNGRLVQKIANKFSMISYHNILLIGFGD